LKDYSKDYPKRGEIWLVSLEPVAGHEIGKTRPALIISNNRNNEFSSTVTLIPITSSIEKVYPFEVLIKKEESGLAYDSKIKCNQIRTVDRLRLIKLSGVLSQDKITEVENSLMMHLDISEGYF
jgi:mRNA interferase MazF